MLIQLPLLAICVVICFATVRWTRPLPDCSRRLIRSVLLSLLFPVYSTDQDIISFAPVSLMIVLNLMYGPHEILSTFFVEALTICSIVFVIWTAIALFSSERMDDLVIKRRLRFLAIVCSLPAWGFIAGLIVYRLFLGNQEWPQADSLILPLVFCTIFSMVAMTVFLLLMDDFAVCLRQLLWAFWAGVPLVFEVILIFIFWLVMVNDSD